MNEQIKQPLLCTIFYSDGTPHETIPCGIVWDNRDSVEISIFLDVNYKSIIIDKSRINSYYTVRNHKEN